MLTPLTSTEESSMKCSLVIARRISQPNVKAYYVFGLDKWLKARFCVTNVWYITLTQFVIGHISVLRNSLSGLPKCRLSKWATNEMLHNWIKFIGEWRWKSRAAGEKEQERSIERCINWPKPHDRQTMLRLTVNGERRLQNILLKPEWIEYPL